MSSSKVLSIAVKVTDAATAPLRKIGGAVAALGTGVLNVARGIMGGVGRLLGALTSLKGLLVAGGLVLAIRQWVQGLLEAQQRLDDLSKSARVFGVTGAQLSTLQLAASRSGIELESLGQAVKIGTENLHQFVSQGSGPAAGALLRLNRLMPGFVRGLTDANGRARSMAEVLPELAEAFSKVPSAAERMRLATDLFGGNGVGMRLLLEQGKDALAGYRREAEALGVAFTEKQLNVAEKLGDALDRVRVAWLGLKVRVLETVGPLFTDLLNRLAAFVAQAGETLGRLAGLIEEAFGANGPEAAAAASKALNDLAAAILRTATPVMATLGVGLANLLGRSVTWGAGQVLPILGAELTKLLITSFARPLSFLAEQLAELTGSEALHQYVADLEEGLIGAREAVDEFFGTTQRSTADQIDRVIASIEDRGGELDLMLRRMVERMKERGHHLAEVFEQITGAVSGYLARLAVIQEQAAGATAAATGYDEPAERAVGFATGLADGFREAGKAVSDFGRVGVQVGQAMAQNISQGLTDAIFAFIEGTERAGEAFKKFALGFLRMVGQMITQALILRAITSAFGAPGANTGGLITARGLARFNTGGPVPGPNVNRDMVPAILTPGEYVLNRRAVRANDRGTLAYMNQGGAVAPVGPGGVAAGGVTVHQEVHIGGGQPDAGSLRQLRRATEQGVLDALRASPVFREQMRAVLA